ncbi:MAG: hypothetical protein WDN76_11015 [Alphaproteobacteria bacterium]
MAEEVDGHIEETPAEAKQGVTVGWQTRGDADFDSGGCVRVARLLLLLRKSGLIKRQ